MDHAGNMLTLTLRWTYLVLVLNISSKTNSRSQQLPYNEDFYLLTSYLYFYLNNHLRKYILENKTQTETLGELKQDNEMY